MTNHRNIASTLAHARVGDCMHTGILNCASDAPLAEVADSMFAERVRAVVVTDYGDPRPVGVVPGLNVVATGTDPGLLRVAATSRWRCEGGKA